jgi:hypothetical protein
MLTTIVMVAGAGIAALFIYAVTRPDTFRVQRTAGISAQPDKVFALINDLHAWASWSPWEKKDLAMKKIHSGATQGKGAVLEWDGNKDAGTGRMEVLKPFEAHNTAEFTLIRKAGSTEVTWAMYGPQPFMMKIMGLFCNPDKMVGKDFEAGLATLKALAEQ